MDGRGLPVPPGGGRGRRLQRGDRCTLCVGSMRATRRRGGERLRRAASQVLFIEAIHLCAQGIVNVPVDVGTQLIKDFGGRTSVGCRHTCSTPFVRVSHR